FRSGEFIGREGQLGDSRLVLPRITIDFLVRIKHALFGRSFRTGRHHPAETFGTRRDKGSVLSNAELKATQAWKILGTWVFIGDARLTQLGLVAEIAGRLGEIKSYAHGASVVVVVSSKAAVGEHLKHLMVVAHHERGEFFDPLLPRDLRQMVQEQSPDSTTLE